MTIRITCVALAVAGVFGSPAQAADGNDSRLYELRVYYAHPGKLDALNARFRDHTVKLFEKHGITNVGYWTPIENLDNKLVYIVSFPNIEAREKAFKSFGADPAWTKARTESEAAGPIVRKIESTLLTATDYSPAIRSTKAGERAFELRTYTATPGKLDNLNARFRDHTVKLFEKHWMTNIGYWTPPKGQKGADDTLIYLLAHKSVDAAKASFDAFRKDPDWLAARKVSEEKAGGSLTAKDGVKSEFMKPTDYSPMK